MHKQCTAGAPKYLLCVCVCVTHSLSWENVLLIQIKKKWGKIIIIIIIKHVGVKT